jgi:nicotinamide phosphoribosyltransferase
MFRISALNLKDFYKVDHARQYPPNTEVVYSNFTARISRIPGVDKTVAYMIQAFVKDYLVDCFNDTFFKVDKEVVLSEYKRRLDTSLGPDSVPIEDIAELHDLGYLPLHVKSIDEGTLVPLRVPTVTVKSTHSKFAWLTNSIETLLSDVLWHPITTATIAFEYLKVLTKYANETSDTPDLVQWQGHDFSMRGQTHPYAAAASGSGHLLSFTGTDTIPAIDFLEHFYGANAEKELIAGSVPGTEHAVMCLGGKETEKETYYRLLTKAYPKGIVSIVSDTWDYWHTLDQTIRELKNVIMSRDGKFVVRPDSGDPILILCGDPTAEVGSPQYKGTVELLWEIFGGEINSKGYKQLNSHIGTIYGDSITLDRAESILFKLKAKNFASTNVVFGIGSYTYQYVTRDTFGFAMKATYAVIDGKPVEIYKDPVTDGGIKKSAKGLLCVNEDMTLSECVSEEVEAIGLLKTRFLNGKVLNTTTLKEIRARIKKELDNV